MSRTPPSSRTAISSTAPSSRTATSSSTTTSWRAEQLGGRVRRAVGWHEHWTPADRTVVRRAARRAAGQAMLLVAATFALAGLLIVWIVVTGQNHSTDQQLTSALRMVDDVTDPPDGIFLVLRSSDGTIRTSPGAPSILPERADLAAIVTHPGAGPVTRDLRDRHGVEFRVRTVSLGRSGTVAQAALSLAAQEEERERLLTALGLSGIFALAVAAGGGLIAGRRAVSGLVDTTSRQRRFVADASHELRTPLTVLTTRSQLLQRHLRSARLPTAERTLLGADTEHLLADCRRLAELLEDLLLAAEPAPDQRSSERATADLDEVARDAVAAMQPLADDRQVTLDYAAGDRAASGRVLVRGGATALGRCVTALLDNATRHTPAGGTVSVAVAGGAATGSISVSDTGPGIPAALRSRLFDRFSHGGVPADDEPADEPVSGSPTDAGGVRDGDGGVDSAPPRPRRYGLGLALVADTAHRLGGTVRVDTSEQGTTFTIRVPRRR